jgi:phospholipase/carboxylesterase
VSWTIPQEQRSQNSPHAVQEQLFARIVALPGVTSRQSAISVPGARGFMVETTAGPLDAFLVPRAGEFAHLHPEHDGSLHLALPPDHVRDVVEKGWGVAHPLAGIRLARGMVMVYGPRTAAELEVVTGIVTTSHAWATGALVGTAGTPT